MDAEQGTRQPCTRGREVRKKEQGTKLWCPLFLKPIDLTVKWPLARKPTRTQLLGLVVSHQSTVASIRFPSDAARAAGFAGFNIVIFRDGVQQPDFVRILGPT